MIPVTTFAGKRVAVFGLGDSGLATVHALLAGGASVVADDDNPTRVEAAAADGVPAGELSREDFAAFDALVLAPGIPLTHPEPHWTVTKARSAGIEVIGDIELFCRERRAHAPDAGFIAVTGTNGKSTTAALIAHIIEQDRHYDVELGGNIGKPILSLEPFSTGRVYVVECSSYQIDLAPGLDPSIGVHLNLAEDHLDRHGTVADYAAVKERLVAASTLAIVGVDDPASAAIAERREATGKPLLRVSNQSSVKEGTWAVAMRIVEPLGLAQTVVADLSRHRVLRGTHNAQNAAAAVAATRSFGIGLDEVRAGLATFPGLPHRLEPVGKVGKVLFVNDSKATNVDAAARALTSFSRVHWIAGGRAKTGGIEALREHFGRVAKAYLIGEAAEAFATTLGDAVAFEVAGDLDTAVEKAARDAAGDDAGEPVVLLAPACASFDQFENFAARGDRFRALVAALAAPEAGPGDGKDDGQ